MSALKKTKITTIILFFLSQVPLVIRLFSPYNIVFLLIEMLFLAINIFFRAEYKDENASVFVCEIIALYIVNYFSTIILNSFDFKTFAYTFKSVFEDFEASGYRNTAIDLGIYLAILVISLVFIGLNNKKLFIFFKYIGLASIELLLIYRIDWLNSNEFIVFVFVLKLFFLILELKSYFENDKEHGNNWIFTFSIISSAIIKLLYEENNEIIQKIISDVYSLNIFPWNTLYCIVILVSFGIATYFVYTSEKKATTAADILIIGLDAVYLMFINDMELQWAWSMMLIVILLNVCFLFSKDKGRNIYGIFPLLKGKIGFEILSFVLFVFLYFTVKKDVYISGIIFVVFALVTTLIPKSTWKKIIQIFVLYMVPISLFIQTSRYDMIKYYAILFVIMTVAIVCNNMDIFVKDNKHMDKANLIICTNLLLCITPLFIN